PAVIDVHSGRLRLVIDDRNARYPLRIDPFIQQARLVASDEAGSSAEFGRSLALSADGSTALIGGPNDNNQVGAAWVVTRSGATWTQQGEKLTDSGEVGKGQFGTSVALSADGNTALIGAPNDNRVGAAWVFTRSGGVWTQQGPKLTGGGEVAGCCGEVFGRSLALSADGNTALIGGPNDNNQVGEALVFTRSGGVRTPRGTRDTGGIEYVV